MVNLENLTKQKKDSYLFIPIDKIAEISWLMKQAGLTHSDYKICNWRHVDNNQVPIIKHLTHEEKMAELTKYYGEDAEFVSEMLTVIISKFDKDELFNAFKETLVGDGDVSYKAYHAKQQADSNKSIPDMEGIPLLVRS